MSLYRSCQYCGASGPAATMVKFSVRRYAHPYCGLEHNVATFLATLEPSQLGKIPIGIARQFNVVAAIDRRLQRAGL